MTVRLSMKSQTHDYKASAVGFQLSATGCRGKTTKSAILRKSEEKIGFGHGCGRWKDALTGIIKPIGNSLLTLPRSRSPEKCTVRYESGESALCPCRFHNPESVPRLS